MQQEIEPLILFDDGFLCQTMRVEHVLRLIEQNHGSEIIVSLYATLTRLLLVI